MLKKKNMQKNKQKKTSLYLLMCMKLSISCIQMNTTFRSLNNEDTFLDMSVIDNNINVSTQNLDKNVNTKHETVLTHFPSFIYHRQQQTTWMTWNCQQILSKTSETKTWQRRRRAQNMWMGRRKPQHRHLAQIRKLLMWAHKKWTQIVNTKHKIISTHFLSFIYHRQQPTTWRTWICPHILSNTS